MILKCKCCGAEFEADNYRFKLCNECKELKKLETNELHKAKKLERQRRIYAEKKKKQSPYSVEKTHRELLDYNEKHGTRLTYGDYQVLKRLGKV